MPKSSTEMQTVAGQLAARAENLADRINMGQDNKIQIKANKKFISPNGDEGTELNVVVLDFISYNAWYDRAYDPDTPSPPACFALNANPKLLEPHETSPLKQAEVCQACPQNQWGSGTGKSKACQNRRLLAVVAANKPDADILLLSISPANIKFWDKYVQTLFIKHRLDTANVITKVTLDDDKEFNSPRFSIASVLEQEELSQFGSRLEEAAQMLMTPPSVEGFEPAK